MTVLRVLLIAAALMLLAMLAVALLALAKTRQRIAALEAERSTAGTRHSQIEYASWGTGSPGLVVHGAGGGFDQGRIWRRPLAATDTDGFPSRASDISAAPCPKRPPQPRRQKPSPISSMR